MLTKSFLSHSDNLDVLLINGHRKCGTTMLSLLFDSHPNVISIPSDLNALYAFFPHWCSTKNYSSKEKLARFSRVTIDEWAKIGAISSYQHDIGKNCIQQLADTIIEAQSPAHVFDSCIHIIRAISNNCSSLVVCKETSSEIYQKIIASESCFRVKTLTLFRDPRDNLAALKKGSESYYEPMGDSWMQTYLSAVIRLKLSHYYGYQISKGFANHCYLRYEDLCSNPETIMQNLSHWLDLEMLPVLLSPTVNGRPFGGNSFGPEAQKPSGSIQGTNIGMWYEILSEDESSFLCATLSSLFDDLGYRYTKNEKNVDATSQMYSKISSNLFYSDRFF